MSRPFEEALHDACSELGLDSHIRYIKLKSEAHTYAEKIMLMYKRDPDRKHPIPVKDSYMYLDSVDLCFYQNGNDVDFAISGNIHGNDKLNIISAVEKAIKLCELTEKYMRGDDNEKEKP